MSHVFSQSDICEPSGGEDLFFGFNSVCDDHRRWKSTVVSREPPQRDKKCLFLGRPEVVLRDSLIRPLEMTKDR